jgi:hypothetical protein
MKITKTQLKQIIKEELDYELRSQAWEEGRQDGLSMDSDHMDKWYEYDSPGVDSSGKPLQGPYYDYYDDGYYQGQMDDPNY